MKKFFVASVAALVIALVVVYVMARPETPDEFYAAPGRVPPTPGSLLRQEPFDTDVPDGAQAWRILYTTTRNSDGAPAIASAVVMSSTSAHDGPRPIVAWTHGTTGVEPGCAPSMQSKPFMHVPALDRLLAEGWVYVATDYIGQGSAGPHPYLIGEGEARSALDAVRAAQQMSDLQVASRVVLWGHSQGGHAALWTGILAPTYAPELDVRGVFGAAPATDLRRLIAAVDETPIGRIMMSYLLRAYSRTYEDVRIEDYAGDFRSFVARDLASRCLFGPAAALSVGVALAARGSIFEADPTQGALGRRLAQNTPSAPIPQPLFIAQGAADELVLPHVQEQFARERCNAGQVLEFVLYEGRDHLSLVASDSPLTNDLIEWTRDVFAGRANSTECSFAKR